MIVEKMYEIIDEAMDKLPDSRAARNEILSEFANIKERSLGVGKWEDCEMEDITPFKSTHSYVNQDGSSARWEWAIKGGFVYLKYSEFHIGPGWSYKMSRKPIIWTDSILLKIGELKQKMQ